MRCGAGAASWVGQGGGGAITGAAVGEGTRGDTPLRAGRREAATLRAAAVPTQGGAAAAVAGAAAAAAASRGVQFP